MSTHFSANQYEQAFQAQRLQNWEKPKLFKGSPSTLTGFTQPISNDRGHILPRIPRSSKSPWGGFVGTWDMKKAPMRTTTMKTVASASKQNEEPASDKAPSPKQEDVAEKIRTPSPREVFPADEACSHKPTAKSQSPSPKEGSESPLPTSPQPQNQESPNRLKTPELPATLTKNPRNSVDKKQVTLIG